MDHSDLWNEHMYGTFTNSLRRLSASLIYCRKRSTDPANNAHGLKYCFRPLCAIINIQRLVLLNIRQWVFYLFVQSSLSFGLASRKLFVCYTKILFGTEGFRQLAFKSSRVWVILSFFISLGATEYFWHLRTRKYKFRFKYIWIYVYIFPKPWRCEP